MNLAVMNGLLTLGHGSLLLVCPAHESLGFGVFQIARNSDIQNWLRQIKRYEKSI
jgi:hypothetical protein